MILFPIYKDLRLGLGNSFADPVDLWAADLKWNAVDAGGKYVLVPDPIVRVLFDRFLLLVLQGRDRHAAGKLAVLCTGLAKGCASSEQGTFWVMAAGASVVRSVSSYAMQTTLQPVHQESIQAVSGCELAAVQGALTDLYAGLERLRSQLSEIESKSRAGGPTPE